MRTRHGHRHGHHIHVHVHAEGHRPGNRWRKLDPAQKIEHLEEYQRDLEQAAADIASKIARLREETTDA